MTADHDDECLCEDCGAEPKPGDVEWAMKQQQSFEYDNDLPLYDAWATLRQEVERLRAELGTARENIGGQTLEYVAVLERVVKLEAENAELHARRPDDVSSGKRLFCDACNAAWVADGKRCCCCKEPFK